MIAQQIPHEDLAIQWDCSTEVQDVYGAVPGLPKEGAIERNVAQFRRLSPLVPEKAHLGYHLCFGTLGGWPRFAPADLSATVDLANAVIEASGRRVDWIHIPVLNGVGDAFFAPLKNLKPRGAREVRLEVPGRTVGDALRVLALMEKPPKPTVALAMGDLGFCTRILAGKYGAPFTYAAFNKERNIAPGMPSFTEMKQVYHFDHLEADAQVFGVIGTLEVGVTGDAERIVLEHLHAREQRVAGSRHYRLEPRY